MAQTEDLDKWTAQLMECKQLNENEIKKLCDKVRLGFLMEGARNTHGRVQRTARSLSSYCLWRYSWSVS
jgi:hypothetical protein